MPWIVLEIADNRVLGATVFDSMDHQKDRSKAEHRFVDILNETSPELSKDEIDQGIKDGIVPVGNGSVCMHWAEEES